MLIAAVDAGKSGAAATLDTRTGKVEVIDLPLNGDRDLAAGEFWEWLGPKEPVLVVVEDCWRPKPLVLMCGAVAAVADLCGAELHRTPVVTWKKAMLGHNSSDKQESIAKCKQLAPQVPLRKPGARTDSADRAEAVLLALYGARLREPHWKASRP